MTFEHARRCPRQQSGLPLNQCELLVPRWSRGHEGDCKFPKPTLDTREELVWLTAFATAVDVGSRACHADRAVIHLRRHLANPLAKSGLKNPEHLEVKNDV